MCLRALKPSLRIDFTIAHCTTHRITISVCPITFWQDGAGLSVLRRVFHNQGQSPHALLKLFKIFQARDRSGPKITTATWKPAADKGLQARGLLAALAMMVWPPCGMQLEHKHSLLNIVPGVGRSKSNMGFHLTVSRPRCVLVLLSSRMKTFVRLS